MGFLKSLAILIGIPIIGFGVGQWALSDINQELSNEGIEMSVRQLCSAEMISQNPAIAPLCSEVRPMLWMQNASVISGGVAVILLLSFVAVAALAGKNRDKIARVFPPLVFVCLFVLAGLVLVQGAILTYGAYIAESLAIHRVHFILIGGIGLGALAGGITLIQSSFKLASKQKHGVMGMVLSPKTNPGIHSFVASIAKAMGARKPDHIVVGLEPNFYVTSADVYALADDKTFNGETLYLSLPLARILTKDEIKAVIGHELGHFRGQDTQYSLRFSPVYAGLSNAIEEMADDEGKGGSSMGIATLPAMVVLSYMIDVFHRNVAAIGREREFEADKAATEVAPPAALATSLLKIGLYAKAWGNLQQTIVERLKQGKITRNISKLFASVVKYDVNWESLPDSVKEIVKDTVSHPTDTHPPTGTRISKVGVKLSDLKPSMLLIPEESCIDLFSDSCEMEEKLTVLQQQYYVSLGVEVPEGNEQPDATLLAALGAHMVLADGKVEPEEIDQAEVIGMELSDAFDHIEFREFCHYPDSLPTFDELLHAAAELGTEGKQLIYDYLHRIAHADDDLSPEETDLLEKIKGSFGLVQAGI